MTLSREMALARGYLEVKTPLIYDAELWKTSGHWGKYRENMFTIEVEGREMGLKPMNCPGHAHLFSLRSALLPRAAGAILRAGAFASQRGLAGFCTGCCGCGTSRRTTAHIFCSEEQVQKEVAGCLELAFATYERFDLEVRLELSTRPEQRIGRRRDVGSCRGGAHAAHWTPRASPTS